MSGIRQGDYIRSLVSGRIYQVDNVTCFGSAWVQNDRWHINPGDFSRVARICIRSVQYKPGWLCSDLRINLPASDATTYWPGK